MAGSLDPIARRFAREATVGLLVIAVLLSLVVYSVAHRFGFWETAEKPTEIPPAVVYRHAPTPDNPAGELLKMPSPDRLDAPQLAQGPAALVGPPPNPAASAGIPAHADTQVKKPERAETIASTPPPRPVSSPALQVFQDVTERPEAQLPGMNREVPGGERPGPAQLLPPTQPTSEPPSRWTQQAPRTLPDRGPAGGLAERPANSLPEAVPRPYRDLAVQTASQNETPPRPVSQRPDPKWSLRPGDTLWKYTERNYGDPQWFRALAAWLQSQSIIFEDLSPGHVLQPPSQQQLVRLFPELVPDALSTHSSSASTEPSGTDKNYVASGQESLFDIAARRLGQASRYVEIVELNREQIPDDWDYLRPLPAGTPLRLPRR